MDDLLARVDLAQQQVAVRQQPLEFGVPVGQHFRDGPAASQQVAQRLVPAGNGRRQPRQASQRAKNRIGGVGEGG
jgi:hypothetical protein